MISYGKSPNPGKNTPLKTASPEAQAKELGRMQRETPVEARKRCGDLTGQA